MNLSYLTRINDMAVRHKDIITQAKNRKAYNAELTNKWGNIETGNLVEVFEKCRQSLYDDVIDFFETVYELTHKEINQRREYNPFAGKEMDYSDSVYDELGFSEELKEEFKNLESKFGIIPVPDYEHSDNENDFSVFQHRIPVGKGYFEVSVWWTADIDVYSDMYVDFCVSDGNNINTFSYDRAHDDAGVSVYQGKGVDEAKRFFEMMKELGLEPSDIQQITNQYKEYFNAFFEWVENLA